MLTAEWWRPSVTYLCFAEFDWIADQINTFASRRRMRHGDLHVTRCHLIRGKDILNVMNGPSRDIGRIKRRDKGITLPFTRRSRVNPVV